MNFDLNFLLYNVGFVFNIQNWIKYIDKELDGAEK